MFQIIDVPRNQSSYSQMIIGVLHNLLETHRSFRFHRNRSKRFGDVLGIQAHHPSASLSDGSLKVSLAFAIRFHDFLEEAEE